LGSGALGFYKKAYDLFVLPANQLLSPIAAVVIAALSRSNRNLTQYRRFFIAGISILAFAGMGIGADLTLIGKDLIRFLLGPGWETSGRIFTYFGPGIGVMLIYSTNVWIHMSIGRADRGFRWGIVEFAVTALLFVAALPFGPAAIAIAWTVSYWVLIIPAFWYAGRPIGFGISPVISTVWKYLLASLLAGVTSAAITHQIPSLVSASGSVGALIRIVTISLLFWALYLGSVVLLHGGYEPLQQVTKLLPDLLPWRGLSRPVPVAAASSCAD
jgi:PST family polysaccharide transporter